jgi:spermidine synthase
LVRRLRARGLDTKYVSENFLPFRMSRDRMLDLELQIEPQPNTPVNRDFAPVAYYFDVALWSTRYHRASTRWIEALASVRFERLLGVTLLALAALLPLLWLWPAAVEGKTEARARRAAAFAVAAMGFTGLGLEILLLLGFQALYGYVYHELTILVALFMVGMAAGAWLELRSTRGRRALHVRRELLGLAGLQLLAAVSPLLLYGLLVELGRVGTAGGQRLASQMLFPALALVAGLLGGFQFLLASRVYFSGTGRHSPGALYGLDLAGACAGALALSVLLIPVYGFLCTAVLMAAANLAPAVLAAAAGRERPAGLERRARS